jgi:hypothetical protein
LEILSNNQAFFRLLFFVLCRRDTAKRPGIDEFRKELRRVRTLDREAVAEELLERAE